MDYIDGIGFISGLFTTLALLFQTIRAVSRRRVRGWTSYTTMLFTIGVALWTIYGILLTNWPIIVSNGLAFVLCIVMLIIHLKRKFSKPVVPPKLPASVYKL